MEAVAQDGVVKGGLKAAWRLARCHPFARGGFDPVVSFQLPAGRGTYTLAADGFGPEQGSGAADLSTDNRQLTAND